jgi:hypothetical protein
VDSAPQSAHIEDGVAPDEADELPDITATGATCNKRFTSICEITENHWRQNGLKGATAEAGKLGSSLR